MPLTPAQQQRVDEIQGFIRTVEKIKRLVAELDSSRAARQTVIDNLSESIARQLSQLRHRTMSANIGTVADQAGSLSVLAGRKGGNLNLRIRGLTEGVRSLEYQLASALKSASTPEARPGAAGADS